MVFEIQKTAIIGKSGAGKSTIAQLLKHNYDVVIDTDNIVAYAYKHDMEVRDFFLHHDILCGALTDKIEINKSLLLDILLKHKSAREELEDFIFETQIEYRMNKAIVEGKTILVDGVLPRFLHHFDQVIEVSADDHTRINNLLKRGVTIETIEKIKILQES